MYKDTVTLFNRQTSREGDTWHPTVLQGVRLITGKAAAIAKYGPDTQNSASLHVRCQRIDEEVWIGSKRWLPPKQWEQGDDYANALTFRGGTSFDFFAEGEFDAVEKDADYPGGFYAYMNKTHDNVFAVTGVEGPFKLIPHFEIAGK